MQICVCKHLFVPLSKHTDMSEAKKIFRWGTGIAIGLYLAVTTLPRLPIIQRWLANGAEAALEATLGTRVELEKLYIGWNGRIVIDGLTIADLQQEELLDAARLTARLEIGELLHGRIRIDNAQLFGIRANIYQAKVDTATNIQFIIDALSSKDKTESKPIDLRINQILIRRADISWNQRWMPRKKGLDTGHLHITGLNANAQLNALTKGSLNLRIKRLEGYEDSGLCIQSLTFNLLSGKNGTRLSDFDLQLPNSRVSIPHLNAQGLFPFDGIEKLSFEGHTKAHIASKDLTFIIPEATQINEAANLDLYFNGTSDHLNITSLNLEDGNSNIGLRATGTVNNLTHGKDEIEATANIHNLYIDNTWLTKLSGSPIVSRIGNIAANGFLSWKKQSVETNLKTETSVGKISILGTGNTDGHIDAKVVGEKLNLGALLNQKNLGTTTLHLNAKGKVSKQPNLTMTGIIQELEYKGYRYQNIALDSKIQKKKYQGKVRIKDENLSLLAEGSYDLPTSLIQGHADIASFNPYALNLTPKYEATDFSGQVNVDLQGKSIKTMTGTMQVNDFTMNNADGTYHPGDIHITSKMSEDKQQIILISPFLEAQAEGNFNPKNLIEKVRQMVSNYLPTVKADKNIIASSSDYGAFTVRAYNAEPLRRLLDIPLSFSAPVTAYGEIDIASSVLWVTLSAPDIQYGKEQLRNVEMRMESNYESFISSIQLQRMMKGKFVDFGVDTQGFDNKMLTRLYWNNQGSPLYAGDISIVSHLWEGVQGKQGFEGTILPSNLIVSDTLWSVHPGSMSYYDDVLQVDSFCISKGEHFVRVEGKASKNKEDILHAQLQNINLEYIFSLINFHAVELTGEATGDAYAHSLFSSPHADAYLKIPQFALNYATLGDLDIHINWGDRPYSIFLDGNIQDTPIDGQTLVQGYITPKKDIEYHGIDLHVNTQHANLYFLNKWTNAIFDDLQGRASGWVHIFGPFKGVNIEGDAFVEEASLGIPAIGVRYHIVNDSVQMRPDNIYFSNARIYDPQGQPGKEEHSARVSGKLHHEHFNDLSFDVKVEGNNILGYDFREFGGMPFFGTVFATGEVSLEGHSGYTRIGIKATPQRRTTLTYNASAPDKLTETPFITYVNRRARMYNIEESKEKPEEVKQPSGDMYIDFDLDITNESTLNLLMDARSGDMISLNGNGHMLAHYYNKGAFNLFGTYNIYRGTYGLSLQEVIHKQFNFSNGGTIVFNGDPYDADLDLQAVHTVSGVSLNDLSAKGSFSNSSARVNCLMNIGGKAREPHISFDFDILNVNEDEKQMVRSLISTEEERNMQVIYLLGIGRFYAYDYANEYQAQSSTAVNSLLSSTLSGTINKALSNMIGSTNWNFGANLRTGDDGWNDMDVEGTLQGNLLNNRLLINGNFGYRNSPMTTSNFIGDFDLKYLLTRSGSVALKAYSETNDRYFTKSALTTQGVGVVLKKDFSTVRDLFTRHAKKNKSH